MFENGFKEGDKVISTTDEHPTFKKGQTGTVIKADGRRVYLEEIIGHSFPYLFYAHVEKLEDQLEFEF